MRATLIYIKRGMRHIGGWLHQSSAFVTASLGEIQKSLGVSGGAAEIGVHHGKLFILLHNLLADDEKSVALDVFEDQHLNTDGSGRGDKAIFIRNLQRHSVRPEAVTIVTKSSLDATPEEFIAAAGPIRLFSVDGGHTSECALNDLQIAEASLADGGIVIVDDVFNPEWPGVATGLAKYVLTERGKLVPFATSPNKVYLCSPDFSEKYRRALRDKVGEHASYPSELFDHPIDICLIYTRGWENLKQRLRTMLAPAVYSPLRTAYRSLKSIVRPR
jgi:hypothetical protein